MKLHTYFRSSAAYRVRIALQLKGIGYDPAFVHLTRGGGEQHGPVFRALNPSELVPVLETDDGAVLSQSLAIIEWLEETHPSPPLLAQDPTTRAQIRAFALAIACDIHPLNNLRVLQYLKRNLGQEQATIDAWYRHWIGVGLPPLEAILQRAGGAGPFCFGAEPSLADICLVPQLANARRYACPLDALPLLLRAEAACRALPAFQAAAPEAQPDAA
ncbi:maleylacetoacetate isomerase [Limobrevibacterium gyesilva]|uniref:Maleylacetoacetate isomerase n=1 Tax=Limobrevibacterium gyesilva TaxID=2991712 RepID=A0AA41YW93_9PROT|nr:maleylacetoacetate isomerase [Limobrevibacterium gyesilva]MCW3476532.1 maleylacetoacetate isomerase [Limobrevibacterium gyesilva]